MAGRPWVPLSDFPLFLGSFNEDPDGHVQLFEVICSAHEIVDDDRKSRIFATTLRGDASEWYANLGVHKRTTYDDLKTNFLMKFREVKHEARIWEEVQCVLRLHRDRLSSHSKSLEENQESTMVVDSNEKKEVELLDKLKADTFARVKPTCLPMYV
ncbi:hypothetical protein KP509_17G019000 [Ceratopteris richardii]|uniref:Retrotransposon gag domain-containing protein n=1 Tax=Ceratopteris richardii TaxID=49495 RepID=A0A8T2SSL0_CERRI|nr:hypothetical protein KP509_17G019000 [Ceratopteris richardii]